MGTGEGDREGSSELACLPLCLPARQPGCLRCRTAPYPTTVRWLAGWSVCRCLAHAARDGAGWALDRSVGGWATLSLWIGGEKPPKVSKGVMQVMVCYSGHPLARAAMLPRGSQLAPRPGQSMSGNGDGWLAASCGKRRGELEP